MHLKIEGVKQHVEGKKKNEKSSKDEEDCSKDLVCYEYEYKYILPDPKMIQ